DEQAQMGTLIGPAVPYAEVADVVEDIVEAYLALRDSKEELFIDTVKRLGVEPFKERVYATR
ncbi:MAG TPA: nitrite/sulfite reductase, partial [Bradyrhizobium sp.]